MTHSEIWAFSFCSGPEGQREKALCMEWPADRLQKPRDQISAKEHGGQGLKKHPMSYWSGVGMPFWLTATPAWGLEATLCPQAR